MKKAQHPVGFELSECVACALLLCWDRGPLKIKMRAILDVPLSNSTAHLNLWHKNQHSNVAVLLVIC